ncbi:MAG: peptidoglycan DD-metalloendopeptidase family protein [bacterium]|nr:peptidoglycan DD-metalloendopeptidase family protein [bacterium]
MRKIYLSLTIILIASLSIFTLMIYRATPLDVSAATVEELQQKINTNNSTIQQLQEEIRQLSTKLGETSAQRKTLQNAINALELNSRKLQNEIKLTESKIGTTDLEIQEIALDINTKTTTIEKNRIALAESLRKISQSDDQSMIETMLIYPTFSTFSDEVQTLAEFQNAIRNNVTQLRQLKDGLEVNKGKTELKKGELLTLKSQLADQTRVIEVNKNEQSKILTQTKSQESTYQTLIADKKAKAKAFEDELNAFQAQLKIALDPSLLPGARSGVLAWPVNPHPVTQYFGNTAFAQSGAYNGSGHNGIDIGTPIGTPIVSAGVGVVQGSGDTDTACPNASFGKWILIKHNNGLSTLYAHLSVIKANAGQAVNSGDVIGYSGNTGYSTGPHLHFTVYASQGVQIISRASVSCRGAVFTMPVADLKAYLNPMSYL